ncbi:DMT family transporter [Clostridioides difficile]|nr:DMT family transporter [Clostridioides difficile]
MQKNKKEGALLKKYFGEIGLIFIAIIWGSGFVATQFALDGRLTPLQIITLRFFLAAIIMNLLFFKQIRANMGKKLLKAGGILGIFLFLAFTVQTIGLMYTTPSKNAFITAANVVIVPFIGFILYRRKLDKIGIISSLVALIGIGILSLEADFSINFGDFLTLICSFGFAFHIFFTSEFAKDNNPMALTAIQFTVAFLMSVVVQTFAGQLKMEAELSGYMGTMYLAVFSTTIGFLFQTICQKRVDGTRTAIILSTEAVFGTIFSIIILKELITAKLVIGSILIFVAIITAETKLSFLKSKKVKLKDSEESSLESI